MLHIINKSFPSHDALFSCLKHILPNNIIVLYEDGVLNSIEGSPGSKLLAEIININPIYALSPDLSARGVSDRVISGILVIDYEDFVELVIQNKQIQPWI